MEDPDRPGDHACPHTLVTSIPDGIHKHKHTHNVNRWIEAKSSNTTCRFHAGVKVFKSGTWIAQVVHKRMPVRVTT